jgi:copper chaperone CopZ
MGTRSLLELTFEKGSSIVHRITFLGCDEYRFVAEKLNKPCQCTEGDVLIDSPDVVETAFFRCMIYKNAVKIVFSDRSCSKVVRSGDILWEVSEHGDLISLCVFDDTGRVSQHCLDELNFQNCARRCDEANHTERMESTMTYNVKTEGMGCPRCMAKVTKAMEALGAEVKRMELNDFTVAYEGAPEAIRSAIEALGFRFISAEAE